MYMCIKVYMDMYILTRKPCVSPSPKLSYVTFETCFSCRRNAFFFLAPKKCNLIEPADTNEFEHVHFVWQGQDFAMVVKKYPVHFRWQARSILSILLC